MNPLFDNPEKQLCPACGNTGALEIVYGFPSHEMMEASREGRIVLGGCSMGDNNPAYRCNNPTCRTTWGEQD